MKTSTQSSRTPIVGKLAEFGARNIKTVHYLVLITIFTHEEIIILENEKNLVTNEQWK